MSEVELTEFIRSSLLMSRQLDIDLPRNTAHSTDFSVPQTDPYVNWLYLVTAVEAICSDQKLTILSALVICLRQLWELSALEIEII